MAGVLSSMYHSSNFVPSKYIMKTCLLLLAVILGVNAATTTTKPSTTTTTKPSTTTPTTTTAKNVTDTRIVGGTAVNIGAFNYQASFRIYGGHSCGAVIINNEWAITAAHCIRGPDSAITLKVGSADRLSGGTIHQATITIKNPLYNPGTTDYDLALVKVSPQFDLSNPCIGKIALPAANALISPVKGKATVSGWGYTVGGGSVLPNELQAVQVTMVPDLECVNAWWNKKQITPRMVCAGGTPKGGTGACNGDSGGPLTMMSKGPALIKILVGVVSWGSPCANPNMPDVYARVSSMRPWIKNITGV